MSIISNEMTGFQVRISAIIHARACISLRFHACKFPTEFFFHVHYAHLHPRPPVLRSLPLRICCRFELGVLHGTTHNVALPVFPLLHPSVVALCFPRPIRMHFDFSISGITSPSHGGFDYSVVAEQPDSPLVDISAGVSCVVVTNAYLDWWEVGLEYVHPWQARQGKARQGRWCLDRYMGRICRDGGTASVCMLRPALHAMRCIEVSLIPYPP